MAEVAHSSVGPVAAGRIRWDTAGVPVYGYQRAPGVPPVSVLRTHDPAAGLRRHRHAHDFVVVALIETGTGVVRVDGQEMALGPGDLIVVGPGQPVDPGPLVAGTVGGRVVSFPADVITTRSARELAERSAPIKATVPAGQRAAVLDRFGDIERELEERTDGWSDAVVALLALLLIDVARIAAADPSGPTRQDDTLLATVFTIIDQEYGQPVALAGIAARVGLSAGHLTTVVRRRTGRTVQGWITERRMSEARRLLVETDLPVHQIGQRVGIPDASYFVRRFRRAHGVTPRQWRRAGMINVRRPDGPCSH